MMQFEHVKTYNWLDAIRGMRNSWESWDKIDSHEMKESPTGLHLGANDYALMMRLVKAGSDHAKFMRQIMVSVDVIAPEYWWKEADTYKVGTVANSTSMMHTLGKSLTPPEAFSMEDVDEDLKEAYFEILHTAQQRWYDSGKKKPSREWRQMNQLTAISFLYRRTFTCNYAVLRSMYHSRKNHRLSEWHEFARWCESLPYAELITWSKEKS